MTYAELVTILVNLVVSYKKEANESVFERIVNAFKYFTNIEDPRLSTAVKNWIEYSTDVKTSYVEGAIKWGIRKNLKLLSAPTPAPTPAPTSAPTSAPTFAPTFASVPAVTEINIWTDGACSGNPGRGGWAALLVFGEHEKELSGFVENTTNNRMELKAAIQAAKAIKKNKSFLHIHSDSKITCGYSEYLDRGWKTRTGKPVANIDLWLEFQQIVDDKELVVDFVKVIGHSDDQMNCRVDALAVAAKK